MAGFQNDSIMGLLKAYIPRQADLQDIVGKLDSDGLNVHTLLSLSESELHELIGDYFPKGACRGARLGFTSGIRSRKELTHEGASLSKKAKLSLDYSRSIEARAAAELVYYEELLEPPADLPVTVAELTEFLAQTPLKLPVMHDRYYNKVNDINLLTLEVPLGAQALASIIQHLIGIIEQSSTSDEATSSASLYQLTGQFIGDLNAEAPLSRRLKDLVSSLDSTNPLSTKPASHPLAFLLRPDMLLFVKSCPILRWENKDSYGSLVDAVHENTEKFKGWSTLFYGAPLPYVIGGCCAGNQFRWLRLVPDGENVVSEVISRTYDLNSIKDGVSFLYSNIRMHSLLQKLQEKL